jgi:hypothetical protein
MTYRRRHRWLRRLALGLAFATFVAPAAARPDEGGGGFTIVTAGGWTGPVDPETGIPLSAGIPPVDEQQAQGRPDGDAIALKNALETQAAAAAQKIHDRYLTDVYVRQGESLGGPDGEELAFGKAVVAAAESLHDPIGGEQAKVSPSILGEMVESRQPQEPFVQGVTDFPKPTMVEQPPVISYLSHGMTADDVVGARPDDRADRFAHSDVPGQPELASTTSRVEWDDGLTLGIGAVVLALALGLGLGFVKRPRLAGM